MKVNIAKCDMCGKIWHIYSNKPISIYNCSYVYTKNNKETLLKCLKDKKKKKQFKPKGQ